MTDSVIQLIVFSSKAFILVLLLLFLFAGILSLLGRGKEKMNGKITVENLNEKYADIKNALSEEILSKAELKKFRKKIKQQDKEKEEALKTTPQKKIFVLHFNGDIKGSEVASLREEITAILCVASTDDEVVVTVESGGGMVHAYGLAAAQLARLRQKKIPLTVIVDKVAASGGYMMACIADQLLAAPFSMIGSIGVIVQLPNFHRVLKNNHIDFEQVTAGDYKRTLTLFGENTKEGRQKLHQEVEEIHHLFKDLIQKHRPQLDMDLVSTGEVWLGTKALELKLIDGLTTSDDYLLSQHELADLYEIQYHTKKSLSEKIFGSVSMLRKDLTGSMV